MFYAEIVAETDDPLFIVPAVIPDDTPVTNKSSPTPTSNGKNAPREAAKDAVGETTQVVTVPGLDEVPTAAIPEKSRRTIRFERPAVRRTTRTVRYIDPLSVFRVALLAHLVLYIVLLLAGVLLWNVANATGTVDNVERFMESFGWESFEFNGGALFHQAWILGLFAVVGLTGLVVLAVTTFNLITDLVGGIRLTVLEDRPSRRLAESHSEDGESNTSISFKSGS